MIETVDRIAKIGNYTSQTQLLFTANSSSKSLPIVLLSQFTNL